MDTGAIGGTTMLSPASRAHAAGSRIAGAAMALSVPILLPAPAPAATIHVPGAYPTIQAGIDAAVDGDEVVLSNGTYRGEGNHFINFHGKAITLCSASGDPNGCIIDCEGVPGSLDYRHGFDFETLEGPDSVVEGITVTGGWTVSGGAARCYGSSPTFRGCVFRGNTAWQAGALSCQWSSAVIEDCLIVDNRATEFSGGAVFLLVANVVIRRCTISGNEAGIDAGGEREGGGISIKRDSSVTIENCIISHSVRGEGVYLLPTSTALISCTNIFGNAGGDWVGAIADQAEQNGNLSADPLFCGAPGAWANYGLSASSPCAPDASPCGLIGALPVSCGSTGIEALSWGKLKSLYRISGRTGGGP